MIYDISGTFQIPNLEELQSLARRVADSAEAGDVLLLEGDLGSGKTAFVKALGLALQVGEQVTSPTFTVAAEYDVPHGHELTQLVHVDLYRLGTSTEGVIGEEDAQVLDEMFVLAKQEKRLLVVEWANKLPPQSGFAAAGQAGERIRDELWRKRAWRLMFEYGEGEAGRIITVQKVDTSHMPPPMESGTGSRFPTGASPGSGSLASN